MARTNTERVVTDGEVVPGKSLTIKWSPERPLPPAEREKLLAALRLAIQLLPVVIRQLLTFALSDRPGPYVTSDVRGSILRFHFKLPTLEGGAADAWKTWRSDLVQIGAGMQGILNGLAGPLVLADAYVKQLGYEQLRAEVRVAQAEQAVTALKEKQLGAMKLRMGMPRGHPMIGDVERYIGELDAGLAEAEPLTRLDPRKLAREAAGNVGGFVRSREQAKGGAKADPIAWKKHLAADDPRAPQLLPQHKGAIHLNFASLLGDERQRRLHVARTLIHEASHKFIDTYDFAYTHDPKYATLTTAQAMRNADSYAFAAVSLYRARLFRDKEEMLAARGDMDR